MHWSLTTVSDRFVLLSGGISLPTNIKAMVQLFDSKSGRWEDQTALPDLN